jgi:demethylmenaquinone methyltransferase/2-methoxy-6-polyprenyl-1,4-benzoquinol methylase
MLPHLSGLGERHWKEVILVLRNIIPVYDKVNSAISLGKDVKFRRLGIKGRIASKSVVLDAGSGYGNMSRMALEEAEGELTLVMYDPIIDMLRHAKESFDNDFSAALSSGIFEYMPFQNETFDVILCGYSLRDAIHLNQAISEIHRILRVGGLLIIVDLGKPDSFIKRVLVSFYLKYLLKVVAYAAAGKKGLKFETLYGTYLKWPRNSQLKVLLQIFSKVEFCTRLMGGAVIVAAYK